MTRPLYEGKREPWGPTSVNTATVLCRDATLAKLLPAEPGKELCLMHSWSIWVISRQKVKKKKKSVSRPFVNLAASGKMQEKIDEPKEEPCGFPAFRVDTEVLGHRESEK